MLTNAIANAAGISHELAADPAPQPRRFVKTLRLPDSVRDALAAGCVGLPSPYAEPRSFVVRSLPIFAANLWRRAARRDHPSFAPIRTRRARCSSTICPVDPNLPPTPRQRPTRAPARPTSSARRACWGSRKLIGRARRLRDREVRPHHPTKTWCRSPAPRRRKSNRGSRVLLSFPQATPSTTRASTSTPSTPTSSSLSTAIVPECGRRMPSPTSSNARTLGRERSITNDIVALREPLYRMAAPSNFTMLAQNGEKVWSKPMPILSGPRRLPGDQNRRQRREPPPTIRAAGALERLLRGLPRRRAALRRPAASRPGADGSTTAERAIHARLRLQPDLRARGATGCCAPTCAETSGACATAGHGKGLVFIEHRECPVRRRGPAPGGGRSRHADHLFSADKDPHRQ